MIIKDCGGYFLPRAIRWSIHTTSEIREWDVCDKIIHNTKRETVDFYVKTFNWKKSRGGGGESTIIRRLHELQRLFVKVSVLGLIRRKEESDAKNLLSLEEKVYLC